jgi:hypothetical protein
MTTTRRRELAPFILDPLDFMEEKIQEALADEASQGSSARPPEPLPYCATACAKTTS